MDAYNATMLFVGDSVESAGSSRAVLQRIRLEEDMQYHILGAGLEEDGKAFVRQTTSIVKGMTRVTTAQRCAVCNLHTFKFDGGVIKEERMYSLPKPLSVCMRKISWFA